MVEDFSGVQLIKMSEWKFWWHFFLQEDLVFWNVVSDFKYLGKTVVEYQAFFENVTTFYLRKGWTSGEEVEEI